MTAWQRHERIGDCDLYLGDCLEVMPTLPAESVRLLWTDPPYGHNNADGDLLSVVNAGKVGRAATPKGAVAILNDGQDEMRAVVNGMLADAVRVLKQDCCCCCGGGGPRPTFAWLALRMDEKPFTFNHSFIWNKVNPGLGWRYKRQHEMVMIAHLKGGKLSWSCDAAPIGNVYSEFFPGQQRAHPNAKPLGLVRGFVQRHADVGEMVLDPFMGSGTTGVACVQLGRKFTGIELSPDYFEIACRRIDEATRQPRMALDGQSPSAKQASLFNIEGHDL